MKLLVLKAITKDSKSMSLKSFTLFHHSSINLIKLKCVSASVMINYIFMIFNGLVLLTTSAWKRKSFVKIADNIVEQCINMECSRYFHLVGRTFNDSKAKNPPDTIKKVFFFIPSIPTVLYISSKKCQTTVQSRIRIVTVFRFTSSVLVQREN